jgi:hypothetical protein
LAKSRSAHNRAASARVALARRLAVIMFAMLKHGAEFEPA